MFQWLKNLFKTGTTRPPISEEAKQSLTDSVSDNLLNNQYAKGKYIPYFDSFHETWNVKDTDTDVCHPMTSANMSYEMCVLLNRYDVKLHDVLNELYEKDRKFEDLGYDLSDLDKELSIGGDVVGNV